MSINEYDRILKENIEPILLPFAQKLLGLTGAKYTSIKDDLHTTIERKPDFLKKVREIGENKSYILQIEFQSIDEKEMVYRMLEYKSLLLRKYKLDVRQFVLYIGKNKHRRMTNKLISHGLTFDYEIIDIQEFDYEYFLKSEIPEEVILAILCNFKNTSPEKVIHKILHKLDELLNGQSRFGKYMKQLEVLAKLRDLQEETIKQTTNMPIVYDLETDIRFIQGMNKGEAKGEARGKEKALNDNIKQLLLSNLLTVAQIAETLKVPIAKVENIKNSL